MWVAASSGLLSPPLLRVIGQGPAQRAVVARATTPCALPTWFNSDWVDERIEAFAPLVVKEGFTETSTFIVDAGARLSVSILLGQVGLLLPDQWRGCDLSARCCWWVRRPSYCI